MKSILWAILVLTITIVAVVTYFASKATSNQIANDGPFRDGIYLGMLDAKYGKVPHPAMGRWSRDSDRQSFLAGYETAYGRTWVLLNHSSESNPNASASYRDGLYLGKLDAEQHRDERAEIGRWAELQDKELFVSGYHQAYLDETTRVSEQTARATLVR